jgi:hypothetical protein
MSGKGVTRERMKYECGRMKSSFIRHPSAFPGIPLLPRNCRSYESRRKPLLGEAVQGSNVQQFQDLINLEL